MGFLYLDILNVVNPHFPDATPLHHARNYRSEIYNVRILTHKGKNKAVAGSSDMENMNEIDITTYSDYEDATRKVWVIENIIKERIGYFPPKVTEEFLSKYLYRIKKSQQKNMFINKAVKV